MGLPCPTGKARLPPLLPGPVPMPRSRLTTLAAAIALPLSRRFSAKGELDVVGEGVTGTVEAGVAICGLLVVAVCLLTIRAASRAAFSTMIACALRLSGV